MEAGGAHQQSLAPQPQQQAPEGIVDKYKRLLSLARSSLEANQASLREKDEQIDLLSAQLEEARRRHGSSSSGSSGSSSGGQGGFKGAPVDDGLDAASIPRTLLRRVDVDDIIWILVEYEGADDAWLSFSSDQELSDYIACTQSGVPLTKPPRSLSQADSQRIEEDCRVKLERITEEFRRYKLRADIARKQKDAEARQALLRSSASAPALAAPTPPSSSSSSSSSSSAQGQRPQLPTSPSPLDDPLSSSASSSSSSSLQVPSEYAHLQGEEKWRAAYERVVRENESLRNRGGEVILAAQWRERFDDLMRERDDLAEKLKIYARVTELSASKEGTKPIEQAYIDLKDEYKEFRRRMLSRDQQRQTELDDLRALMKGGEERSGDDSPRSTGGSGSSSSSSNGSSRGLGSSSYSLSGYGGGANGDAHSHGLGESKHQYIRSMLLQFLCCREPEVKTHIEAALLAIFRFSEVEKAMIEERKKSEALSLDSLAGLSNLLGINQLI